MWKIAWGATLTQNEHRQKEMIQMKTHEDLQQILDASEQLLDGVHEVIDLITLALQAVREGVDDRGKE